MILRIESKAVLIAAIVGFLLTMTACGGDQPPAADAPAAAASGASATGDAEDPLPPSELDTQLPPGVRDILMTPFTGDLDEMVKRRLVRIGVTYNRTFYFVDKGVQRGVAYEFGQMMEERLNKHFKTGNDSKVHVLLVPMPRDMLPSALIEGKVDLVAAQVTVRPELQKLVDFSDPTRTNVNQILVTGAGAPAIASVDDLSGKRVMVRERSAYEESLKALNEKLASAGKAPVEIEAAPRHLEDDDLLEMVNAGLIPAIIVDDYLAKFWKQVFTDIVLHENVAVHTGGSLAIAMRKNSPKLAEALNTFMENYGLGTSFGNQIERRYLKDTKYAKNATSEEGRKQFQSVVELFRKYSDQYQMDFLLMAAQAYQESQLNQNAKSRVGAIGIMQIMPATGKELNVGDIKKVEPNIHAGVKYVRQIIDNYYKDEPMDDLNKGLFAFASYNAGPARVRQLRAEAEKRGLDKNVWFGNVEQIASERIGRETVTYVANIYKYYIAYRLVSEEAARRETARESVSGGAR